MDELKDGFDYVEDKYIDLVYEDKTQENIKFEYKILLYLGATAFTFWVYESFKITELRDKVAEINKTIKNLDLIDKYENFLDELRELF